MGWDGTPYLGPRSGIGLESPDGLRLLVGSSVVDLATGAVTPVGVVNADLLWADDSRHLCVLAGAPGSTGAGPPEPATLSVVAPGSAPVKLASLGVYGGVDSGVAPAVLACSEQSGRVVLIQREGAGNAGELWLISIAGGAVIAHLTYPRGKNASDLVTVAASHDGRLLAENAVAAGSGTAVATIRALPGGAVLARLPGTEVHGFSWDGRLAMVTPWPAGLSPGNSTSEDLSLLDWRTGKVFWRASPGLRFFGGVLSRPGGGVALDLNSCATPTACQEEIWLVTPGGQARRLVSGVVPAFPRMP